MAHIRFSWLLMVVLAAGVGCSSSDDEGSPVPNDDQPGADINTSNYKALLEYVFTVANTGLFDQLQETVETIYGDDVYGLPEDLDFLTQISSSYDPLASVTRYEYACSDGGIYRFVDPGSAFGGGSGEFEACRFDDVELNGSYGRSNTLVKYVYSTGWSWSTSYDALTSTSVSDGADNTIDGFVNRFDGSNENEEQWSITRYTRLATAGETIVTDAKISLYVGDEPENPDYNDFWKRTFSSSFTVQSPQTGNKPLTITTEELFVSTERAGTYANGILQVRAADGSEIRVVADNGDPSTFQADITSDGTMSSFTIPWEGDMRLRCLVDPQSPDSLSDYCR